MNVKTSFLKNKIYENSPNKNIVPVTTTINSDHKLVMSLKYDNSTLKIGGLFGRPVEVLPLYTVRTIFSTPQQSRVTCLCPVDTHRPRIWLL